MDHGSDPANQELEASAAGGGAHGAHEAMRQAQTQAQDEVGTQGHLTATDLVMSSHVNQPSTHDSNDPSYPPSARAGSESARSKRHGGSLTSPGSLKSTSNHPEDPANGTVELSIQGFSSPRSARSARSNRSHRSHGSSRPPSSTGTSVGVKSSGRGRNHSSRPNSSSSQHHYNYSHSPLPLPAAGAVGSEKLQQEGLLGPLSPSSSSLNSSDSDHSSSLSTTDSSEGSENHRKHEEVHNRPWMPLASEVEGNPYIYITTLIIALITTLIIL